jgi:hypothetical protein
MQQLETIQKTIYSLKTCRKRCPWLQIDESMRLATSIHGMVHPLCITSKPQIVLTFGLSNIRLPRAERIRQHVYACLYVNTGEGLPMLAMLRGKNSSFAPGTILPGTTGLAPLHSRSSSCQ